jgi:hypothetical protein
MAEVDIENVLKVLRDIIGGQAQEIAVLKASLEAALTPTPYTTAVPEKPNATGPQGIQSTNS